SSTGSTSSTGSANDILQQFLQSLQNSASGSSSSSRRERGRTNTSKERREMKQCRGPGAAAVEAYPRWERDSHARGPRLELGLRTLTMQYLQNCLSSSAARTSARRWSRAQ